MIQQIDKEFIPRLFKEYGILVRDNAVLNVAKNSGELSQSIFSRVNINSKMIEAVVYTNNNHAMYVEFGTGPKGQANHEGISPNIKPVYVGDGWVIPADKIDKSVAEQYRMIPFKRNGEVYGYYTRGQAAKPYLYPALKNNENRIIKDMVLQTNEFLRKVAGKSD